MHLNPVIRSIDAAKVAIEANAKANWIIGFSGGKDSSAMLKIMIAAYSKAITKPDRVDIIYCDTGVENPILDIYVKSLLRDMDVEFESLGLPFKTRLLKAPVQDRFFVKVIGRGYPTPTNKFRWCTDKLRVKPVTSFITDRIGDCNAIVCLGLRRSESVQRDRTLEKYGNEAWQSKSAGSKKYAMFLPILDLSVSDVWDVIHMGGKPLSLKAKALDKIYRGAADGECPIIKAPSAAACGSGRFGCWTCTVVRKDKSMISLIEGGNIHLTPYLEFRDWIAVIRDDPARRWKKRRNGVDGLGPMTLAARREILARLLELQDRVKEQLITKDELSAVYNLWELDIGKEELGI